MLQIDTLILNGYRNFSIALTGQFIGNIPLEVDNSVYIKKDNSYPNFICPLTLKTDTTNIQISLDDKGGYLLLLNVYKSIKDTLRISKVVVYSNCYRDTTFTRIDYYHYKPDSSLGRPYKTKFSKTIAKKKCKNRPLFKTTYKINGVLYLVSFQIQEDFGVEVINFHGYKPIGASQNPDTYKGKLTRFHGQSTTSHYINVITLRLKNGT